MPKVFARYPGAEIRVGNFGVATAEIAIEVPEEIATALTSAPDLRVVLHEEAETLARRHRAKPAEPADKE